MSEQSQSVFTPDGVFAQFKGANKKQLLLDLSKAVAEKVGLHERQVYDVLIERERLGSTGLGNGIAIPHGRLQGLDKVYSFFVKLEKPVDFEAIDAQPVDLLCLLLAPAAAGADHLTALARVSRLLRDSSVCAKLRGSESEAALLSVLSTPLADSQAA